MAHIVPISGAHAIANVSFGVEWQEPLAEKELEQASNLHSTFSDWLPRKLPVKQVQFTMNLGQETAENLPRAPVVVGYVFDRIQEDNKREWSFAINPTFMAITCWRYTNWNDIWPRARRLMEIMLPVVLAERSVHVFGLQYHDLFLVEDDGKPFAALDAFRTTSRFLPPHVFECDAVWHAHHGYFEVTDQPVPHRRLHTINTEVIQKPENQGLQINILTSHRALLAEPVKDADRLLNGEQAELDGHFLSLHSINKGFLRDLLNDSLCHTIGLDNRS